MRLNALEAALKGQSNQNIDQPRRHHQPERQTSISSASIYTSSRASIKSNSRSHIKLAILPAQIGTPRGDENDRSNDHAPDLPDNQTQTFNMRDENEDAAMTLEHIAFERQRAVGGMIDPRTQSEESETTKAMQPYSHAFRGGSTTSRDTAGSTTQTKGPSTAIFVPQLNSSDLYTLLNGRTEMIWRLMIALLPSEQQARFCVDNVCCSGLPLVRSFH
jgi:hypothetical protein